MSSIRTVLVVAALALPPALVAPAQAAELYLVRGPDGRAHVVQRPPRPAPPAAERGWATRPDVLRYEPASPRDALRIVGTRRSIRVDDRAERGFRAVQDPGAGATRPGG